jgi:phenylalanyl-tRNA synthetase beta chain
VRKPHEGEKLTLLNGKEIDPRSEAILISTETQAIGLGGVMGGANSEVDEHTKNIILECANFNMYSIRKTSMHHGIFSDAVTRFNKGQSPLQNLAVLAKIVSDVERICGGKVSGEVIDDNHVPTEVQQRESLYPDVKASADFINTRLGSKLSADEMAKLLQNVEFKVAVDNDEMTVRAPFWRTDIEIPEDIVEEVGRLYGYDNLPLELPRRPLIPTSKDVLLSLKSEIRRALTAAGANELLTYSFVHGNLIDRAGQNKDLAFKLSNALSPDLQYYRLSLTPNLLDKIHPNIKAGYDEFALFELGKSHLKNDNDPLEPNVPKEVNNISFIYASKSPKTGAPYYVASNYLQNLLDSFGVSTYVALEPLASIDLHGNRWIEQMVAPFEPGRSAVLRDSSGLMWGVVGEYKSSIRKAFKLPENVAGFEIDPLLLLQNVGQTVSYASIPRYPRVTQDITLKIPSDIPYQKLHDCLWQALQPLRESNMVVSLEPLDIYQRDDDQGHKQITLRLSVASYEKTMTDPEVTKIMDDLARVANEQVQAERI